MGGLGRRIGDAGWAVRDEEEGGGARKLDLPRRRRAKKQAEGVTRRICWLRAVNGGQKCVCRRMLLVVMLWRRGAGPDSGWVRRAGSSS